MLGVLFGMTARARTARPCQIFSWKKYTTAWTDGSSKLNVTEASKSPVTAKATMAATLARMGQNPVTKEDVFDLRAVRDALSVMFTCGMYDYSGNWTCDVGIPAKSGVGGGVGIDLTQ